MWSRESARVDRLPKAVERVASDLPAFFPADDSDLPDVLVDPPGRARLAYHPRESFDVRGGWASERVFFLGLDGSWRSLEMVDLGLPESSHPGWDTYGAGEVSPDGTTWAAPTNAGVVMLDFETARSRVVPVPGDHTRSLHWKPDGGSLDVVRVSGASKERTWSIKVRGTTPQRAAYDLPLDGFTEDGAVVTFSRAGAETLRTIYRKGGRRSGVIPVPYRHARLGGAVGSTRTMFALNRGLLVVDNDTWMPIARLRLGPTDAVGWPRGWWDKDTVWFQEGSRGLLTWNVVTGETEVLTRVRPAPREDSYWTSSVALDLMR